MSSDYIDPLSRQFMESCPSLARLDWSVISPREDGACLVYGWAASEVIERGDQAGIAELAAHLNDVFELKDEAQTTAATVGALESWAMSKKGVEIARALLTGEALRMFELQSQWIKAR